MARRFNVLPGFGLSMGITLFYLGIVVLLPLSALAVKVLGLSWTEFWSFATKDRALAAYRLTFGASLVAALVNAVFGSILAWVLVRYQFWGKRMIDAMIDIPFALPTAVAGLTLANLYVPQGWLGRFLVPRGIEAAYSELGVVIALIFVSLPFVVRTVQPVLEGLDREVEEAAATLGAGRFRTLVQIVFPTLLPAVLTGFAMSFARAIGEYGSVIFISGNLQGRTEIAPFVIVTYLEEFNYGAAISLSVVLLIVSFALLGLINLLERWSVRFQS